MQLSKVEFLDLTPYEFSLLVDYKKDSDRGRYQLLRNVVFNAGANLMRGKNSEEIPLFENNSASNIPKEDRLSERQRLFGENSG